MTSCCWLVVMGSERFASPIMGIFCGGLNAYCMRIWPLFLRTSGSSGVLKALLLERNRQLSCNQKKKKKMIRTSLGVSQAPVRLAFSMACCLCSKLWGCRMHSDTCIPQQGSSLTQPPQARHQPESTDGLSLTACFRMSTQLQFQTSSPLTIMGSLYQSLLLLHPHVAQAFGQCHPASSHTLPSRSS